VRFLAILSGLPGQFWSDVLELFPKLQKILSDSANILIFLEILVRFFFGIPSSPPKTIVVDFKKTKKAKEKDSFTILVQDSQSLIFQE